MQDGLSQVRWSVVGVCQRTLKRYMETLEEGSLTVMTVMKDGSLRVWRSVVSVRLRTLRKKWETLRNRVSYNQNGSAGRTVVGMTVRRRCPLEDTWKKWETFRNRVSDNQNGCAGDVPSWERWSVACVRLWTLGKNWTVGCWGCWNGPYDGPSWVRRSVIGVSFCHSVTELRMPHSSSVTHMEYLVLTYIFLPKHLVN